MPYFAIDFCLKEAGILLKQVDNVAFSHDPYLLLNGHRKNGEITLPLGPSAQQSVHQEELVREPNLYSSIVDAPRQLVGAWPSLLERRFRGAPLQNSFEWHYVEHHLAHAASAFLPSPFEESAIIILDGQGEKAATVYARGYGNDLDIISQVNLPNSLGLLSEQVGKYLGVPLTRMGDKLPALAFYGKPTYLNQFRQIVQVGEDGQYETRPVDLIETFGPARINGEPFEQRHYDIACSLQAILEESVLQIVDWLHVKTRSENLCLAGSVALNGILNTKIRDYSRFKNVWVQPAAGDAGAALGAALWIDARERHSATRSYCMDHIFLGPEYNDTEIEAFFEWSKLPYRKIADPAKEAAKILAAGKTMGWFQGRLEFGLPALGGRSILASPLDAEMLDCLDETRDDNDFQSANLVVLEEDAARWFKNGNISPFKLFMFDLLPEKAEKIPAAHSVDDRFRLQTINAVQNPLFYEVLKHFKEFTEVPILINTSFNTSDGHTVVSPRNAIECFWTSPLDVLIIGSFLLEK